MANLLANSFLQFLLCLMVQKNGVNTNGNSLGYLDPLITKSCPKSGVMFIKGYDVKLSDFVRTNGEIYNLCSCKVDLSHVKVFALNSLVIDTDLDVSGSSLKIFFFAPRWIIVGNRKIAVDGSIGEYVPKAADGNEGSMDGHDGNPGHPGGPGGHFFGIGESFVNGKSLTITANGGIGGTGQDGGNGYNQVQARYVDIRALGKIWCGLYYDICRSKEKEYHLNLLDNHGNYSDFYCQGLYEKDNMERCSFKIFGWEGEAGGKGGNGGRGGKGGLPGSVKLVGLMDSSKVSTFSIFGVYGKDGKGGIGGRKGQDGHNVIYEDVYFLAQPNITFEIHRDYEEQCSSNGSNGYNTVGYQDVVEADVLEPSDILNTINEYNSWLREISLHEKQWSYSSTFYKHISENIYVRNLYNTLDFFDEARYLDEELYKTKSTANFVPFYESLLDRIHFFVKTYKNDDSREEDRTILSLLYTDILGRIINFDERAGTYLVVEIPPYLEFVKENLLEVGDLIQEESAFDIIVEKLNELREYKENYKYQVHELIQKSRHNVDSTITVEMDTFLKDEEKKFSALVSDIIRFKEKPLNYEQELLTWGKQLQDSLLTKSKWFSFKQVSKLVSVLSDFLEIVSSVVEIGAQVPAVLRLGEQTTNTSEFSAEAFIKTYNRSELIKTEEVTSIIGLLDSILNKTKNYPELLFDMSEEVLIIQKKLQNDNRFLSVNALRSDLLHAVKIKIGELLSINMYPSYNINAKAYQRVENSRSAASDLSTIMSVTTLSRGYVGLYNEYKHNKTKLVTIVEYISRIYNILQAEKHIEDSIYMIVYQLLQRITDNIILDLSGNIDSVSKLAFEVGNWKIPLILDNVKQKAQQLANNYPYEAYFVKTLESLERAFSSFTDVLELVRRYYQQIKLENHILDTTLAVNKEINFTNVTFANKYETIIKGLGSNLILQNYKRAADTFKLYVFPIADIYFKDIILPSHFNMYDDVANIVSIAVTQIDKMLDKVEDFKESMLNGDGIMGRKDFGGREFPSENPFFVWKNEQYKDTITDILSGKQVTVNADITKSDLTDNAITFNRVDFYFTSSNETVQRSINYVMEYFKIYISHLGNSHYRYGSEIYLKKSDVLNMFYHFENDEYEDPVKASGSYYFIRNVDITLSPFTWWKIRLVPIRKGTSYDELLVFKDDVDFELGGNGFFISKENISAVELKVKKYYTPLDKYDEFYAEANS